MGDSQNTLIKAIPGGEELDIGGAVLVAKSCPSSGKIVHVTSDDISAIKTMLVRYVFPPNLGPPRLELHDSRSRLVC